MKSMLKFFTAGFALMAVPFLPLVAFAQEAVLPNPETDLASLAQMVLGAAASKDWALLVVLVLFASVFFAKKYLGKWLPWLNTTDGEMALFVVGSILGALGTALVAGQPWGWGLLLNAVLVGLAGAGTKFYASQRATEAVQKAVEAAQKQAEDATDDQVADYFQTGKV